MVVVVRFVMTSFTGWIEMNPLQQLQQRCFLFFQMSSQTFFPQGTKTWNEINKAWIYQTLRTLRATSKKAR